MINGQISGGMSMFMNSTPLSALQSQKGFQKDKEIQKLLISLYGDQDSGHTLKYITFEDFRFRGDFFTRKVSTLK